MGLLVGIYKPYVQRRDLMLFKWRHQKVKSKVCSWRHKGGQRPAGDLTVSTNVSITSRNNYARMSSRCLAGLLLPNTERSSLFNFLALLTPSISFMFAVLVLVCFFLRFAPCSHIAVVAKIKKYLLLNPGCT